MEVDITTYSDADFNLTQGSLPVTVGSNPLHMQVRSSPADPTAWIECTTANGLLTVAEGPETITIHIPQAKLATLVPGSYVYSVIMSSLSGTLRTEVFRGTLTHNAGPTQWAAGTP